MLPEEQWPTTPDGVREPLEQDDPEVKTSILVNAVYAEEETDSVSQLISRTSSWSRLRRIMAWILRFKIGRRREKRSVTG